MDLFTISSFVNDWEGEYCLSEFEKLVLILEDRRFFQHGGFDPFASLREFGKKMLFRKHGGASTIDMQFVRTATGFRQKTVSRKLYEMLLASLIQFRFSKLLILRSYLDHAYFGSGLTGAEAGSRATFGRSIPQLDRKEAAILAAMLVYPRPRKPGDSWKGKIEKRANYGLLRLGKHEKQFEKFPRRE